MTLFQKSVFQNYLKNYDTGEAKLAFSKYKKEFLPKIENIKKSKEEQYQYGFLDDLFVKILGYTLNPSPEYNLTTEYKNQTDSKKADGAIIKDDKVIGVIELKSTKTKSMDSIVNQAFNYKNNHSTCRYVITSNFEKLRLYIDFSDRYIEFNLFEIREDEFIKFYYLLNQNAIFQDIPLKLKEQSKLQEENISNELYKKYAKFRINLFENIVKNNPNINKHILLTKTQTILDRMVFIFFAEDRGILPANTITAIKERYDSDIEDRPHYHFFKIYFEAINSGNTKLKIPAYNGGLFAKDELLDSLIIDDDVLNILPKELSAYDFNSDIDVNILGHIFENSLSDLEEIKSKIDGSEFDTTKTKRKKDGVFYTPEYITKYIVDNTLGKLCQDKRKELKLEDIEIDIPKNPKKLNKKEQQIKDALESYREYLLGLKILDPACGSGAFLNQALSFLLKEHDFIDQGIKTLMGGAVLGLYDIKKDILENNLYGVDINAEAVEIAKLSLWLRTVESGRKLNKLANKIKVGNSLIDDKNVVEDAFVWEEEFPEVFEQGGFDCVIGNPPYVPTESIEENIKRFLIDKYISADGRINLYIIFYEVGLNILNKKGKLGFITPYTLLKNKYYSKLRQYILKNYFINEIIDFNNLKIFEDATVDSIILIISKYKSNDNILYIDNIKDFEAKQYVYNYIEQNDFIKNSDFAFHFNRNKFIDKIFYGNKKLKMIINFNQGIITGNNKEFLINVELKNYVKIIRGADFNRYYLEFSNLYLDYTSKKIHRPRKKEIFEVKKLLLRQTGSYPIVTIDENKYYTLDTVHNGILIDKNYSLKFIMTILNSKLMRFIYESSIQEQGKIFAQVKIMYIDELPIKITSQINQQPFVIKADLMLELNKSLQIKKQKFLKRLKSNFDIDKLSKKLEIFYELDFKTFLQELKKKKVILSLIEQDEWEEYFESYQKELLEIKAEIDKTDKKIDEMVYELYGLSDEEILIVENSMK